jgi:hypothetical protein
MVTAFANNRQSLPESILRLCPLSPVGRRSGAVVRQIEGAVHQRDMTEGLGEIAEQAIL